MFIGLEKMLYISGLLFLTSTEAELVEHPNSFGAFERQSKVEIMLNSIRGEESLFIKLKLFDIVEPHKIVAGHSSIPLYLLQVHLSLNGNPQCFQTLLIDLFLFDLDLSEVDLRFISEFAGDFSKS